MLHVSHMKKNFLFILFIFLAIVSTTESQSGKESKDVDTDEPYKKPELVLIPGGEFIMGNLKEKSKEQDKKTFSDDFVHKVYVDSFYIDKYEVTNAQYYRFCLETKTGLPEFWGMNEFHCGLDYPNHPVVGVSYRNAQKYAKWRGMRLPTEAEWEYAARGGLSGKKFSNGDELDAKQANFAPHSKGTKMVSSYPANGYGLYDMTGNVAEWVSDYYADDYFQKSPYKNPQGPDSGKHRVIRGGGWHTGKYCSRVFYRNCLVAGWVDFNVGFRCAKSTK